MVLLPQLRGLGAAALVAMVACGRSEPVSQFGAYHEPTGSLRLPDGRTMPVYRVKPWTFADGSPPALQLEYEPPVDVADSTAARRVARAVWPVFAPYVVVAGTPVAIVTATNLRRRGGPVAWTATLHHFGLVARRAPDGRWRFDGDTAALPSGLSEFGRPKGPGIFEPDGTPLAPFTGAQIGSR